MLLLSQMPVASSLSSYIVVLPTFSSPVTVTHYIDIILIRRFYLSLQCWYFVKVIGRIVSLFYHSLVGTSLQLFFKLTWRYKIPKINHSYGALRTLGMENLHFQAESPFVLETRQAHGYYGSLIGSYRQLIYPHQFP